jgi:glycosyltransferase involved in cell wall biosynthesis
MVFEVRDLWPEVPIAMGSLTNPIAIRLARLLERMAYRASARIIALSEGMKDEIVAITDREDAVVVIPNMADVQSFGPQASIREEWMKDRPELQGRKLVGYCGTLGRVNGAGYLVDVARSFLEMGSDAAVFVVGSGLEEESIRTRARNLQVLDVNFFMYGAVPKQDMSAVLASASILTSTVIDVAILEMNSANKFFDGLAAGKPFAVNHGGWQAETLHLAHAGIQLSRDPTTAARQLDRLLNDDEELHDMGRNAASLAEERFERSLLTERFVGTLESVCLPPGTCGRE